MVTSKSAELLDCLESLVCFSSNNSLPSSSTLNEVIDGLNLCFSERRQQFSPRLQEPPGDLVKRLLQTSETDSCFSIQEYVVNLTDLLHRLAETFCSSSETASNSTSCSIVSAKAQRSIITTLELIVGFGVLPSIEPSFGIPFSKRIKNPLVKEFVQSTYKSFHVISIERKAIFLYLCTSCFMDLLRCPELKPLIVSKFLYDVLCSLLQLSTESYAKALSNCNVTLTQQLHENLSYVMNSVYKPAIVRELLLLQATISSAKLMDLKNKCGQLLSECLTAENGFSAVVSGILDFAGNDVYSVSWKECESIASVVSAVPRNMSPAVYIKNICNQLLRTFVVEDGGRFPYAKISSCCVRRLFTRHQNYTQEYLFKRLLAPLDCLCSDEIQKISDAADPEAELSSSIRNLHSILCCAPLEDRNIIDFLQCYLPVFLQLHMSIIGSACYLVTLVREILCLFIEKAEQPFICQSFKHFVCCSWTDSFMVPSSSVTFQIGENNGVVAVLSQVAEDTTEEDFSVMFDSVERNKVVLDLLNSVPKSCFDSLLPALIASCMEQFFTLNNEKISKVIESVSVDDKVSPKLCLENDLNRTWHAVAILVLLETILETFAEKLSTISDLSEILRISKVILLAMMDSGNSPDSVSDSVMTILGILKTVLLFAGNENNVSSETDDIITLLKKLASSNALSDFKQFAQEIINSLGKGFQAPQSPPAATVSAATYHSCLKELSDPIISMKAKAVFELTELLKKKDSETLAHEDEVLEAFIGALDDADSYLFLAAVSGLAVLGSQNPKKILPVLLERFLDPSSESSTDGSGSVVAVSVELRLKLGEALVGVCCRLGDLVPFYGDKLVHQFLALFRRATDKEQKASCLSSVGEVCRLQRFKLHNCIEELLYCIEQMLLLETEDIIRRAATHVLYRILDGCGRDLLEAVGDNVLRIYRLLKQCYSSDRDYTVRLHAQLALEVIDSTMREMIRLDVPKITLH